MAATLAVIAAMCFALAAAWQQRGQLALAHAGKAVQGRVDLVRLAAVAVWLLGPWSSPAATPRRVVAGASQPGRLDARA